MPWASEPTLEGSQKMTERDEQAWRDDRVYQFALIEKETGEAIGVAGLKREGDEAVELHYWIRSDRAGRGLVTEAGLALIGFAREDLGVGLVTLWAGRDNLPSRRVAEKLGFVHVGPLPWRPEGGRGDFPAESYELRLS